MQPLQAYGILKQHLTNQDSVIRQKVLGLLIGNSILLTAFFLSMEREHYDWFRLFLVVAAIGFCVGFGMSLVGDVMAKRGSVRGLGMIEEEPDFAYLKGIQSRPITDIERRGRGPLKLRQILDFFWPVIPLGFIVIWLLALGGY